MTEINEYVEAAVLNDGYRWMHISEEYDERAKQS